jgi:hypothetical protein
MVKGDAGLRPDMLGITHYYRRPMAASMATRVWTIAQRHSAASPVRVIVRRARIEETKPTAMLREALKCEPMTDSAKMIYLERLLDEVDRLRAEVNRLRHFIPR